MLESEKQIRRLFRRFPVMDMVAMEGKRPGRSRRSLYRDLSEVGYLSSYTHAGRYYTLADIPDFDDAGLWWRQGVGFSKAGTLKSTVTLLVDEAEAGHTHGELESRLRVRVHNALLGLVRERRLGRERIGRLYLYVSDDAGRAAKQMHRRKALMAAAEKALVALPTEVVISVLVEALQASEGLASEAVVAARLAARGQDVTAEQVERIYAEFGLVPGKKTVEPP